MLETGGVEQTVGTWCNQRGDGNNSYFRLTAQSGNGIPLKVLACKECQDFHISIHHSSFEMPTCEVWTIYLSIGYFQIFFQLSLSGGGGGGEGMPFIVSSEQSRQRAGT